MIKLTKLNRTPFTLNAIYIERVETIPDTVVTMLSGKKIHVLESVDEVIDKVTAYYQKINLLPSLQNPNWDE
ncbi:Flagellar protein (FlbD) [Planococcus massiliensis]|uniref:Flagellar protein (FlbD) n=2 Tax=Planococcus TaxID=1372 RepID=A0A098ERA3_9BACL|nr:MULTISPECIES: flagellar FlbD family protein [Planococcus]MCJ1909760.1 flagellar FlbD family protein [Planococcus ruber]CEG24330.1 Flagellar protein (FlbD) [Planococcus massiliensis]